MIAPSVRQAAQYLTQRGLQTAQQQGTQQAAPLLLPAGVLVGQRLHPPWGHRSTVSAADQHQASTSGRPAPCAAGAAPDGQAGALSGPQQQPPGQRRQRRSRGQLSSGRHRASPGRSLLLAVVATAGAAFRSTGLGLGEAAHAAASAGASLLSGGVASVSGIAAGAGLASAALLGHSAARRLLARRSGRKAMAAASTGGAARELSVVTFNIRGVMDRWAERAPLLAQCLADLDADVVAFQEVLTGEFAQDARLLGEGYTIHECRAALASLVRDWGWAGAAFAGTVRGLLAFSLTRSLMVAAPEALEAWRERNGLQADWARSLRDLSMAPFFGNSIASRLEGVGASDADVIVLGDFRAAQRVLLTFTADKGDGAPDGSTAAGGAAAQVPATGSSSSAAPRLSLWLVNTHLDHAEPKRRAAQAAAVCGWMALVAGRAAGVVVTGDLNAPPDEAAHDVMEAHGYVSANKAVHGREPAVTWPTGLQAPLMDVGEPHCADYVYVWQAPGHQVEVLSAELRGNRPADGDATLYPSDHAAVRAQLRVSRRGEGGGGPRGGEQASGKA